MNDPGIDRLRSRVRCLESAPPQPVDLEHDKAIQKLVTAMGRLIARRPRSRREIAEALERRDAAPADAAEVIDRLTVSGLLDDSEFARLWVDSRRRVRALGPRALRAELARKGVAATHIDAALAPIGAEDEEADAAEIVRRRLPGLGDLPHTDPARAARRLDGVLQRKGYDPSISLRVVRRELRRAVA